MCVCVCVCVCVMEINCLNTIYCTAVTITANEILGRERCRKKSWDILSVVDLCEDRRDMKKWRYEPEEVK